MLQRLTEPQRFLCAFFAAVSLAFAAIGAGFLALHRAGLLPAPPLAATHCIDSKFAEMRRLPLDDRDLVAVGSSATWRNLDMSEFERRFPGTRAYNAAPCFIHADQTTYLTEFLLERMPRIRTIVTVVAPRDFGSCSPQDTAFFDPDLAHAYLSRSVPGWVLRITGFRPLHVAREALRLREERARGPLETHDDGHGSSILRQRQAWSPPLRIDRRCYAALTRLETVAAKAGVRLAVATLPVMPEWAATFDPDGVATEAWFRDVEASLRIDTTLLIDGRALPWDDARFADPVHLIYPHHRSFTRFVVEGMARRWHPAGPADRGG